MIAIRCFTHDPSVGSSLKFLRKTPWARTKVEDLYVETWRRSRGSDEDSEAIKAFEAKAKVARPWVFNALRHA